MKLGLLGTIIGFILMLAPIAGLDAADRASVKSSMGLMSDGMAVAMYTTLTGLVGSVLVQTQYYMLDEATAKLFGLATDLTEVFVVSVLERRRRRRTGCEWSCAGPVPQPRSAARRRRKMESFGNYPREKFDPFSVMLFKGCRSSPSCSSSRCW